jgi:uncharacterized membrane protein HdeD (DUF308 family)
MKARGIITLVLGILLACFGVVTLIMNPNPSPIIPTIIGISLIFLSWRQGRIGLLIFGHSCVVLGCFLITWGIYLIPYSEPTISHIFMRPLFWGFFSLFGGICSIYHGFCKCITK